MIGKVKQARRHKALFLIVFLVAVYHLQNVVPAGAQSIQISSSPNPVGSGARALGMGGAFIAVADDATAASWNPGGLVQLERPEVSVVGEGFYRTENNMFGQHPEASGGQSSSGAGVNYLSVAYPFTLLNRNMVVSLNYQHLYDFSRNWNFTFSHGALRDTYSYEAGGGLYAAGIAYALQIIPQLSFGFTLNFWQDGIYPNEWETKTTVNAREWFSDGSWWGAQGILKDRYSFSGFNANMGLLWSINDKLTLGAVFKTPFTANLRHQQTYRSFQMMPFPPGKIPSTHWSVTMDEKLDMPMSYGVGLAYRFSDRFTLSADVSRTHWQDFVLTDATGIQKSPITAGPISEADIDPTTQFHLGAEYLFIQPKYTVPVRAGFFYDPAPAPGSPDNYYGFSIGSGIGVGRFIFDAAYVYRFGRDVGKWLVSGTTISQNVNEHGFYTSMIIHF